MSRQAFRSRLMILVLVVFLTAPTPPTGADVISLESEIRIGREAASEVEQQLPLSHDPVLNARVQRIGRRLAAVSGRPELPFEFHVVNDSEINAFALPGGFVYVYRGLMQAVPNDDALAFIIGHEIAHATRRHSLRQFKKNTLVEILSIPLRRWLGSSGRNWLRLIMMQTYSRNDESEADHLGLENSVNAGFSPDGGAQAMETLLRMYGKGGPRILVLLQDHPATDARLKRLKGQADKLRDSAPRPVPAPLDARPVLLVNQWIPPLPASASAQERLVAETQTPPTPEWLPLKVGNRWRYLVTDEAGTRSQLRIRVLEQVPQEQICAYRLEVSLGGGEVQTAGTVSMHGSTLYRLVGAEWQRDWSFASGPGFKVVGEEIVTVPHGTYTALRIERLDTGGKTVALAWFVRGLGMVKRQDITTGITEVLETTDLRL